MKHSFIIIISVVSAILLIQGCIYKDYPSQVEQPSVRTLSSLTKSVADRSTPIVKEKPKVITREALEDILAESFQGTSVKNTKRYSLKTISEEGKPIIHSVNFDDGGWTLVAGRELPNNQIIACGEEGSFDPDNIESPEVRFWFRMTKASLKLTYEVADREAESQLGTISAQEEEERSIRSISYDDPFVWVRLYMGYETSNVITNVNHLTNTKWGQSYPWNYKCPSVNNDDCPLGCLTVAVAQLLYYLHFHLGTPSGCYHTVDTNFTWNSPGNYYTSNLTRGNYTAPSPRWNAMPTVSDYLDNDTKYVGDLMIDVADRLGTAFSPNGSGAFFTSSVFPYYNINCSTPQQYSSSQTIAQLDNSMPVLVYGDDNNAYGNSHAWLIDGYKKQQTLTDYQYKWVIMPPDSLQYYNNINYNYVFTDTEMHQFYPDIEENQIVHEYSYSTPSYLFRMNWGWNGFYNGGLYSIQPEGWNPGNHQFSLNNAIITGFTN